MRNHKPSPEQLAAFVDGELDADGVRMVEAWLAVHPEAEREVEAQRWLSRLWESAPPPEPSPEQWADVLQRIEAALPAAPRRRPNGRQGWAAAVAAVITLAAAAVLAAVLWPSHSQPGSEDKPPPPPVAQTVTPLPVLGGDEVTIISMDSADRDALVVGEFPLHEPLALLSPDEITIDDLDKDAGMQPEVYGGAASSFPMIVVPVRSAP